MPAYVSDFEHDIFISYGCVDDQPGDAGELGWVSTFLGDLRKRLSERLGRKDNFTIWRDEEKLARNVDLSKQIADAIESSACLLIISSPGYLHSDWCKRERSDFLRWIRDRNASGSRVFVVERDWIESGKPEEFKNVLGFKFWTGDPANRGDLPRPLDKWRQSDSSEYKDQLNAVALAIESELRRIKTSPPKAVGKQMAPPATEHSASVFLAEVTDDLRPQWKKVRNELEQRGLRVLSGGSARDVASLETAVNAAMEDAQIFVQLLGQFPGQTLEESHETYAMLQYRLATNLKKRVLQWRAPTLTEELFDSMESEDPALTQVYRQIVFGKVRAEHIEDFKTHVIAVATEKPQKVLAPTSGGMVFISFAAESKLDAELGGELCDFFDLKGVDVVLPLSADDADPQEISHDFENSVLSAQGWIVVYCDERNKLWARGQLSRINQLLCQRERRGASIHLCAGPPHPKPVESSLKLVGMKLQQMKVIDCQRGFDCEKIFPFLDALGNAAKTAGALVAQVTLAGNV
jgi:TIR domain